mmetsp:Transcript_3275/g.6551  ORF Transcript_3275/g.6551 Transcript_3275/m.6551 type:complete len:231 (+) Transcript_3275:1112-1804(+)
MRCGSRTGRRRPTRLKRATRRRRKRAIPRWRSPPSTWSSTWRLSAPHASPLPLMSFPRCSTRSATWSTSRRFPSATLLSSTAPLCVSTGPMSASATRLSCASWTASPSGRTGSPSLSASRRATIALSTPRRFACPSTASTRTTFSTAQGETRASSCTSPRPSRPSASAPRTSGPPGLSWMGSRWGPRRDPSWARSATNSPRILWARSRRATPSTRTAGERHLQLWTLPRR